jgi:hypothetical protein
MIDGLHSTAYSGLLMLLTQGEYGAVSSPLVSNMLCPPPDSGSQYPSTMQLPELLIQQRATTKNVTGRSDPPAEHQKHDQDNKQTKPAIFVPIKSYLLLKT